jgi:hypothetical protein
MTDAAPTPTATEKAEASVGKFKYPPHPIAAIFPLLDPTIAVPGLFESVGFPAGSE